MIEIEKPKIETIEISEDAKFGKFVVEPLERGYGTTLGNSLRRILLSSLPGTAVTDIQMDGVLHEFSTIDGVVEDVAAIILNIKKIALKSFTEDENKVLENLSFKLQEGKKYALVGHSGSGKSTIVKLLSGFYKIDSGSIKIGEKPLEAYSKDALINTISFVFQDSKLFKKSIYENVALANKKASREEVMKAMELAGCNVILNKFPDRENTMIGSKGVYLSGGEKQRIAIARAMLKKSKIVIMDEASASIDPDNEYELQKAFKNLMKDKTVIMIAHRMSSIRSVDEILVLDNGEIIERGSDQELISQGGKYKELLELYDSANQWRVKDEEIL